ncbi:MAG TPA: hypothetical protein VF961_03655 [Pyrinomonadaceae bacterium]
MKRCPKCSRTFPDDNQKFCTIDGGLLVAEQAFDPNATFRSSAPLAPPSSSPPAAQPPQPPKEALSGKPPDFGATIATSSSAPTAVLPRNTGPTGMPTIVDQPAPAPPAASAPLPPRPSAPLPQNTPSVPIPPPQAKKKSKMPLIIGILLLLLVLGVGAVAAAFFLIIKPRLKEGRLEQPAPTTRTKEENTNTNSNVSVANEQPKTEPEFVAPPNTVKFANSQANLDSKLAEHYFDFSFYYPSEWKVVPKTSAAGGTSFIKVERSLPPDFTQENFGVGWYDSKGSYDADQPNFPHLVEVLSTNLSKSLPEYRKVSEGPTKVNSLNGYELRFVSFSKGTEKGDLQLWGRVIFLPRGEGETTGAILTMLTTSLAPEISGVDDVGVKGEAPVILESFRFGKKP